MTGPDQDTTHLEFKLTPGAVLRGVVTSDDGEPVAGARVMLFKRPKLPAAGERTAQVDAAITDDTGSYEIGDLAAGEYLLAVVADPWYAVHEGTQAKRNAALDVAYPVTYFDSTTEERSATRWFWRAEAAKKRISPCTQCQPCISPSRFLANQMDR